MSSTRSSSVLSPGSQGYGLLNYLSFYRVIWLLEICSHFYLWKSLTSVVLGRKDSFRFVYWRVSGYIPGKVDRYFSKPIKGIQSDLRQLRTHPTALLLHPLAFLGHRSPGIGQAHPQIGFRTTGPVLRFISASVLCAWPWPNCLTFLSLIPSPTLK